MEFIRRWARRRLEALARQKGETVLVIPAVGAAMVLREGEPLQVILPSADTFIGLEASRPVALCMAGMAVALRDRTENLTVFEAITRAGVEFGFSRDVAQSLAGDFINSEALS